MTTVAFQPLTDAENAFKTVIWNPMVKAGETWLDGAVPFLALPVIQGLSDDAIEAITDALFHQIVLIVDVTSIELVDAERQAVWDSASEKLEIIAKEQGASSDAYKQALAAEAADFATFVSRGP